MRVWAKSMPNALACADNRRHSDTDAQSSPLRPRKAKAQNPFPPLPARRRGQGGYRHWAVPGTVPACTFFVPRLSLKYMVKPRALALARKSNIARALRHAAVSEKSGSSASGNPFRGLLEGQVGADDPLGEKSVIGWTQMHVYFRPLGRPKN